MKKILFLSILVITLNAQGLTRFVNVETYQNFSENTKRNYLKGSADMLWERLGKRFGHDNKISLCMDKTNKISGFVDIYDSFLSKNKNKYNRHSAAEIFALSMVEHCKRIL